MQKSMLKKLGARDLKNSVNYRREQRSRAIHLTKPKDSLC